jgi:hypothetical protein
MTQLPTLERGEAVAGSNPSEPTFVVYSTNQVASLARLLIIGFPDLIQPLTTLQPLRLRSCFISGVQICEWAQF